MSTLKDICVQNFKIQISRGMAVELNNYCKMFELRDENPLALNTAMLGVHLAHFFPKDQTQISQIFGIDLNEFKYEIYKSKSIDTSHRVATDPYNILTIWLLYLINNSTLPAKLKYDTMISLCKLLQYKFFTSLTNHYFRYRANEEVMHYTINNLSGKYDIKKPDTPTWKLVIEKRSADILAKNSIHYKTLKTFSPDNAVFYVITDTQTKIRSTLKNIYAEYKYNLEHGKRLAEYGIVEEVDGEKLIRAILESFDVVIDNVANSALNVSKFIDHDSIKLVVKMNSNLREDMLRDILIKFSEMATYQHRKHEEMLIENKLLKGYKILISHIIQKTYRRCMIKGVNLNSKLAILETAKNLYTNSRINDEDILNIKTSVEYFVNNNMHLKREQTLTALKIGFILYILLLSMKYVN